MRKTFGVAAVPLESRLKEEANMATPRKQHRIAVIPGDGIGKEVVPEGVRENAEGEYSSVGGRMFEGTEREIVVQQSTFSRHGVDRILKFAFELARKRPEQHVTSATKSNGISITMPYWDERFRAMAAG